MGRSSVTCETFPDDTPLHQCVLHSMQSAVRELLEHGSDVNFLNRAGYSPLHLALQTALQPTSVNIIRGMVKRGYRLDLNREDIHGKSNPLSRDLCFVSVYRVFV